MRNIAYRRIAETRIGRRLRRVARQAPLFSESARFLVDGLREPLTPRGYHLRSDGSRVWLRLPVDSWTFHDIFIRHEYKVPELVRAALPAYGARVVDLGANVGLFGIYARQILPECRLIGFEPDPDNLAMLQRNVEHGEGGWYEIIDAAAGASESEVTFAIGLFDSSHEADEGVTVQKHDVLPTLAECDLAKIDIEGGEWEILQDPRLGRAGPTAIVLEYHQERCPDAFPHATARRLLAEAGYRLLDGGSDAERDQGIVWALRADD
jgi:FkbM family methyltransferase